MVHNGFYTSMEALRGATYEELVDSGVRPVHAKLIISNLGSKDGFATVLSGTRLDDGAADEVGHFLRSVGLENCAAQLAASGFASLETLGDASIQDLLDAGLKPVHARLIVSNLDSASTAGINMTPAAQRLANLDAEESGGLLGTSTRKPKPRRARLCVYATVLLLLITVVYYAVGGTPNAGAPPAAAVGGAGTASGVSTPPLADSGGVDKGHGGEKKHMGEGKHKGGGKGLGGEGGHGGGGGGKKKPM